MNNRGAARSPSPAQRQLTAANAAIEGVLDTVGWSMERLLTALGNLAEANKTVLATKDGEFTDSMDIPDNPIRLNALTTMLQLRRAFPASRVEVGGTVRVEQLHAIALQLSGLSVEQLGELIEADDAVLTALPLPAPESEPRP